MRSYIFKSAKKKLTSNSVQSFAVIHFYLHRLTYPVIVNLKLITVGSSIG